MKTNKRSSIDAEKTGESRDRSGDRDTFIRRAAIVFLVLYPVALFALIWNYPEKYQRVDLDYHFTMNAFMNHGTPDLRPDDLKGGWMEWIWNSHPDPWYCLAKNADGKVYGHHFWLWPLMCAPLAKIFSLVGLHPLLSQPVTLALFLWLSLCVAWRYIKYIKDDPASKFLFILMAGISPALFYLWVLGGEGFMYVMTLFAVVAASRNRFEIAAACVATAALQNTSMMPFAGCLAFYYIMRSPKKARNFAVALLSLCPFLASPLFYLATFGHLSALADIKPLSVTSFSLRLFMMEFFDWNGGLMIVIPAGVLLYLASIPREIARIAKAPAGERTTLVFSANTAAIVGGVLLPFSSSIWYEWNTAYIGVMRWALPIVPLIAWLVSTYRVRISALAASISVATMVFWMGMYGWGPDWVRQRNCYIWSGPAKVVLKYAPAFCVAWNDESMYERTLLRPYGKRERDGGASSLPPDLPVFPIIYSDPGWGPRKIMTTRKAWSDLRKTSIFEKPELFRFIDEGLAKRGDGEERAVIFDMPAFKPAGRIIPRIFPPDAVAYSVSCDIPQRVKAGVPAPFTIELLNLSEMPLMPPIQDMPSETAMRMVFGTAADDSRPEGIGDLITIDSFPFSYSLDSGKTLTMSASITLPSPGQFYFKALLGQIATFFTTEEDHGWACVPIEVTE